MDAMQNGDAMWIKTDHDRFQLESKSVEAKKLAREKNDQKQM